MTVNIQITSLQNPRIKHVIQLANRRQRDEARQTVVEGIREVVQALENGVVPVEAYLCPELLNGPGTDGFAATTEVVTTNLRRLAAEGRTALYEVTTAVFGKMAYRGESGGVLLVIPYRQTSLDSVPMTKNPFLLTVVGAEKPGNLGAILRTADAAGVDGIILPESDDEQGTDIHNPNTIRASLGAYFTVPVAVAPAGEVVDWLISQGIVTVATTPAADTLYTAVDMSGPVAVVMGSEAYGLSESWLATADRLVHIPMLGAIDSLNLSAATALLLYEVVRQRGSS